MSDLNLTFGIENKPHELPGGHVDKPYSVELTKSMDVPHIYGVLPAGLKSSGRYLKGTPEKAGTFKFYIQYQHRTYPFQVYKIYYNITIESV